jgi:hypothetical protein
VVSVRQPVLHHVLTYNWVLALVSLLSYASIRWPRPIEWSYYPLYLGLGWLLKSFLQQRIADAVAELHQSGALPAAAYPRLSKKLDRALNHRVGVPAFALIGALLIVWFFWPVPRCSWTPGTCWLWWIAAAIDVVYGYAVGAATWKAWALARHVRAWGREGYLTIRPRHPDGAGGLAAIGRLFLSLSRILAVGGLFCAVWLILATVKSMTGTLAVRLTEGLDVFLPWLAGALVVIIAIGVVAFVAPMMTVHRLMQQAARQARVERDAIGIAIAELEGSLLARGADLTAEHAEPQLRRLRALRDVYGEGQRIPTWPVEPGIFPRFAASWAVPVLAAVTSVEQWTGSAEKLAGRMRDWLPSMKQLLP